jgi:hypothetical protein
MQSAGHAACDDSQIAHASFEALTASAHQQRDDACAHQDKQPPNAKQAGHNCACWPPWNVAKFERAVSCVGKWSIVLQRRLNIL